jgi:prepilin-type N-terminal cleavage/methylation domain-containing protein
MVSALGSFTLRGRVCLATKVIHPLGCNGFTLLKLMLAIGIFGVLVAIAIPATASTPIESILAGS